MDNGKSHKKAEQSVRQVANTAVKAAKTTAKTVVEGAKAAFAAEKEIAAAIIGGSTGVIVSELLSPEYESLWAEIIGSSGEILIPSGSFVGTDIFTWPLSVSGTVTSRFGTRADPITGEIKTHGGTDIAAPTGTPILAAADGVVEYAGYNEGGYGFYVRIRHNAVYETLYGHCSVLHVTTGQTVKQGQKIAEVGSTGRSTGPHCHFEVIQNGVRIDALRFYK